MRAVHVVALSVGITVVSVTAAAAQGQPAPKPPASVPLRMQLVISRYQGDKRVSATPFTFVVNATDPLLTPGQDWSRVRMGVEVPITSVPPSPDAKQNAASGQAPTVQYRPFGTNIDCLAQPLDNGRFKVSITIEESTPYSDEDKSRFTSSTNENRAAGITPVFRSIRLNNTLLLKDGQSEQMSSATDRFSGEVVKVDVTLSVIKP
jgi:hypothetical protein